MSVPLEAIVKQLTDSGIISPGKLKSFVPPNAHPQSAEALLTELVKQRHLTRFQAQYVYAGKARSLFLGGYTILDRLGAGGMGQVFKAQHRRMDRVVALKTLPTAMVKDTAAVARFEREVRAAARLEHSNIVTAYDADQDHGVHFLVMQYVDGRDLAAIVKQQGPLPVGQATSYILQAARGLEFAHAEGVVHRDIKPANLLVDKKGVVKILDMGLARIDTAGAGEAELTGTGAVMGTVDFMAPEQALDTKTASKQSDIYSLGCSLYYLLTGGPIYPADSVTAKLLAHQTRAIPGFAERQDVSPQLEAVFRRMVAKQPEDRYASMTELIEDLAPLAGEATAVSQPAPEPALDSELLSMLSESPPTLLKPSPAKAAPTAMSGGQRLLAAAVVGAGLLAAGIAGLAVHILKSHERTLIVEVEPADAVVQVLNPAGKVEIRRPGQAGPMSIVVEPGRHRLLVEKDRYRFFAQDFEVQPGQTERIKAKLTPLGGLADSLASSATSKAAPIVPSPLAAVGCAEFQQWAASVAALPAERQADAVALKLKQLNPGFDGKVNWKIENGVVTELEFAADDIEDISPVRALAGLTNLHCEASAAGKSKLSDLSPLAGMRLKALLVNKTLTSDLAPLRGMPLTRFFCSETPVADLGPLAGMKLTQLGCNNTKITSLAPLKGMPLTMLYCYHTGISDLAPLAGMPLATLSPSNTRIRDLKPLAEMPIRQLNITNTPVADLSPLEGCRSLTRLIAGKTLAPPEAFAALAKALPGCAFEGVELTPRPISNFKDPAFQQWVAGVAALSAQKQLEAVVEKLKQLNPGFDGKVESTIESGAVKTLNITSDAVSDISPVRALAGLSVLLCNGTATRKGSLQDLSPLEGMKLTKLYCGNSMVSDLRPVAGMKLQSLALGHTNVADIAPVAGMSLKRLALRDTMVADLSPLKQAQVETLDISESWVSDLEPLGGLALKSLDCSGAQVSDIQPLSKCASLATLNLKETGVTASAIAALAKALPRCNIESDPPPLAPSGRTIALRKWPEGLSTSATAGLQEPLPGLVAEPAPIPALGRWQIETAHPRGEMLAVDWSPNGERIVAAGSMGQVRVFEASSLRPLAIFPGHPGVIVYAVAWSPDGTRIATGGDDGLRIWSPEGRPLPSDFISDDAIRAIKWSPDGQRLAVAGESLRVCDPMGKTRAVMLGHTYHVYAVAWSSDGAQLVSGGADKTVRIWNADGSPGPVMQGHEGPVRAVAWNAAGGIASRSEDETVRVWRPDGVSQSVIKGTVGYAPAMTWTRDGKLVLNSPTGDIKVLAADGSELKHWKPGDMRGIALSPDGKRLASAGGRNGLRHFDLDGAGQVEFNGEYQAVRSLAWSPDGARLASAHEFPGSLRYWDASGAARAATAAPEHHYLTTVVWGPTGDTVLTAGSSNKVRFWDAKLKETRELADPSAGKPFIHCLALSPDGGQLASGAAGGALRLWDLGKGTSIELKGHPSTVYAVAWSPRDPLLASVSNSPATVRFWKPDGSPAGEAPLDSNPRAICWSRDGKTLFTSNRDGAIERRDRAGKVNGELLVGHSNYVHSFSASPDGTSLVSGSSDQTARVWNLTDGASRVLRGHQETVGAVAWSSAGQIATGSFDGTIRVWDAATGALQWSAIAMHDEKSVTFSPGGRILNATADIASRLVWLAERADGSLDMLSPTEFAKRAGSR